MLHVRTETMNQLQEMIYGRSSLRFSPARFCNLEARVRERLQHRGLDSLEAYLETIRNEAGELDLLIEQLTTKETYFFRIPEQFQALKETVLPRLEDELSDAHASVGGNGNGSFGKIPLRIWCAGCSTGPEPYSVAMTVFSTLRYPKAWQVEILATDLSLEALAAAARGCYAKDALERNPREYHQRYLTEMLNGIAIAKPLVDAIDFAPLNLCDLIAAGGAAVPLAGLDGGNQRLDLRARFDIVFCRNVMIYFDFPAQQGLVNRLFECLKPGGYLFTGDAELLHIYSHRFETVRSKDAYFYRKPTSNGACEHGQ